MKKRIAILLFAALVLTLLCACGNQESGEPVTIIEEDDPNIQIANPFVDYETLDLAEKAAGFTLKVPESIAGYSERIIQVANGKMLQVMYFKGDSRLTIRKEKGIADISGDYNRYKEADTEKVGGRDVSWKGGDGAISCAVWLDGEYTYALTCDDPLPRADAFALIESIQ